MPRPRWILLPATALVAAALAQSASAAELCVHRAGYECPAGSIDKDSDLQDALDDASNTAAPDVIRIATGIYLGPFTYAGGSPLHIVGAGTGKTNLHSGGGDHILETGGADVSRLSVRMPAASPYTGLSVEDGSTITDVEVNGDANPGGERAGIGLYSGGTLRRVKVVLHASADHALVSLGGPAARRIVDSTLHAYSGVVAIGMPSRTIVSRSTIEATKPVVVGGARLEVDNTVLQGPFTDAIRASCGGVGSSQFYGDHLTIVGDGSGTGLRADCDAPGLSSYAALENTVIASVARPWSRETQAGGGADLDLMYSSFRVADGENIGLGNTSLVGIVDADPGFAPDGLRPAPGSPLIDAGAEGAPGQALDRDVKPRLLGARQDIGAFEFDPASAPPGGPAEPAGPGGGGEAGAAVNPDQPLGPAAALGVTQADILAELRRTIARKPGRRARTRYAHRFLVAGTLTLRWTKGRRVLARARLTRGSAGRVVFRVKRTRKGRRLLRRGKRVRLVVRATFTPTGATTIRASRRATLRAKRRR